MEKLRAVIRRGWAVVFGLGLSLVLGMVEIAGWHPSLTEPPFQSAPEWWLSWLAAPVVYVGMLPVLGLIDVLLLGAMVAHPVRPRWWTALITISAVLAWTFLGVVVLGIGV